MSKKKICNDIKIQHTRNRQPIFWRFIFSYIIILIIPIITIGIFSYHYIVSSVTSKIHESILSNLRQIQNITDMRISSVDYIAANISRNLQLRNVIVTQDAKSVSSYEFFSAIAELKNYTRVNPFIDNIFIYRTDAGIVLGCNGKYNIDTFLDSILSYQSITKDDFLNIISSTTEATILSNQNITSGASVYPVISYIARLPISESTQNSILIITVKSEEILNLLNNILSGNDGELAIFDSKGHRIFNVATKQVDILSGNTFPKNFPDGVSQRSIKGANYTMFSVTSSTFTGWKVVGAIKTLQILSSVNYVKFLTVLIIFIELLIGIAISFYFSKAHYSPIKKLVESLPSDVSDYGSNEYDIIASSVLRIIQDKNRLENLMNTQYSYIKTSFMQRLLYGGFTNMEALNNMASIVGESFGDGPYALIIFSIFESLGFEINNQKERISCMYALKNVAHELFAEFANTRSIEISLNRIAIILEFKKTDQTQWCIDKTIEKITKIFAEHLSIKVVSSYDIITENILNIPKHFIDITAKLDHIILEDKKDDKNSDLARQIIDCVIKNYADNNLSLTTLSYEFNVSTSFISKLFKSYTNYNFLDYLHLLRLEKVKDLLVTTDKSISEIALETGYSDSHSVIRSFKRYNNMTPGQYRQMYKKIRI